MDFLELDRVLLTIQPGEVENLAGINLRSDRDVLADLVEQHGVVTHVVSGDDELRAAVTRGEPDRVHPPRAVRARLDCL